MDRSARQLVVAATAAVLCAAASMSAAQALFNRPQDALAGSRVFGAKGCARCHAVNGSGGTVGPDLARTPRPRTFHDLSASLWNHLPAMASEMRKRGIPRAELTTADAANLIAFLYSIDYFDRAGDPDRGRLLFSAKRCITCHQHGGAGGVVGPNLDAFGGVAAPIDVATAMWNHAPAMSAAMVAHRVPRPALTGQDLRDLIAFISAADERPAEGPVYVLPGRAVEGERLFTEKRCALCHAQPGRGGGIAPDLAARAERASLIDFAAAMWNKTPAMTAEMRARGVAVPTLTTDQMADIVAYLYSVRYLGGPADAARGRAVAAAKGCTRCHGPGERRVRPLFAGPGLDSPAAVAAVLWNHPFLPADMWSGLTTQEMADLTAALQRGGR